MGEWSVGVGRWVEEETGMPKGCVFLIFMKAYLNYFKTNYLSTDPQLVNT